MESQPALTVVAVLIGAETLVIVWLLLRRAARRRASAGLEERLRFETLLSEVSAGLIHVPASGIDAALERGLRQVVAFMGVDRGHLSEYVAGRTEVRISSAPAGTEKLPQVLEADAFPWTAETLRRGDVVRFSRREELPETAATDRASYARAGTRSHVSLPLRVSGPMLGVLSFDAVRSERAWPDELVERLRLLSEAFASALERKRIEVSLAERLRFEKLLSSLSTVLSNLSAGDFDREIQQGLRQVVAFLGLDRGSLIEFSRDGQTAGSWATEGWKDDHVKPQVAVPLTVGGTVVGELVFSAVGAERAGSDELTQQLRLLGEVFANALSRKQGEREAQRLRQDLTHIGRVSAMGELTASLAHELNQPLTAILSNAQAALRLLDAGGNLAEIREILNDIVADDKQAADLISRLRALVKKGDLERVALDINAVVAQVAWLVRYDATTRHVSMSLELAPDLPSVHGDRVQLQQVVLNLVLNGMEAMRETPGDRSLVIRTAREDGAVVVSVQDSGPGIDERDGDRMFQALYTTKPEGLGMGLAIARTIVEAHGGRLAASNNAHGGAIFQFTLPVGTEGAA